MRTRAKCPAEGQLELAFGDLVPAVAEAQRDEGSTKICESCGRGFARKIGYSRTKWAEMRCCSLSCSVRNRMRKTSRRPDCGVLRDLYESQRLSTYEIGERVGVNAATVGDWLRDYGIAARKLLLEIPDRDTLARLAHVEHRPGKEIGDLYGVNLGTVHRWLKRLGIPPIDVWDVRKKGNRIPRPDAETLRSLYESGKTLVQIGETYGVTHATVTGWCHRGGIVIRESGYNYNKCKRYVCDDGIRVRSSYEKRVADWLYSHSISYEYEPKLPFKTRFRGDFLANGWYIEVWGIDTDLTYRERKERKKLAYKSHGVPLIGLAKFHFKTASADLLEKRLSQCLIRP